MMHDLINTVLDGYKILAKMGSGSSGIVYQAENTISKQLVALKILSAQNDLAQREQTAIRFYQTIEHPNLIRIHHVGQIDDMLFYTMDWCECSLAQRKVSPEDLVQIAKKLAGALAELHRHGLIHRDIKPDNIFFRNGEIVLGDIGLVTSRENATFAGSPGFLAPVLLNGQTAPNEYTDCYALAKTLYCTLSGERPDKFPDYSGPLNNAASLIMQAALAVCSSKPKIQTASELLHFLVSPKTTARSRKIKLWIIPTVALLIMLLMGRVFFIWFRSNGQKQIPPEKTVQTAKSEPAGHQKTSINPAVDITTRIEPKAQREIQKKQQARGRKTTPKNENGEIRVRRAWNEQNRILITQLKSPLQRFEKEFEIEWNNMRIDLLERSSERKISNSEFSREDRNLVNLWKAVKWILKSGISAETLDLDYGELKEKLTIDSIEMHQVWVQTDNEWQIHKQDCIRELLRKTKETGRDPYEILREMAENDSDLRFFGIEQAEYLGQYEEIRFSGKLQAKQEADEAIAKYIQARQNFLKKRKEATHQEKLSPGT